MVQSLLSSGRRRTTALLLGALLLVAGAARAEEWHDAYQLGLRAQARGEHARAVEAFRRAIALRPVPGRNVVTYGTNVIPRYYPYLRLAESYLGLGRPDLARDVLEVSEASGQEPADERHALQAKALAALDAQKPRPPSPPATTVPATTTTPAAPPATAPATTVGPAPSSPPPTAPPATTLAASRPSTRPAPTTMTRSEPSPAAVPPATTAAAAPAVTALEILSTPPGAQAYVDDEPVGSTDPLSGRLVKTGIRPGRLRLRLSHEGHEDVVQDVAVEAGTTTVARIALKARPAAASGGPTFGGVAFVVVALGLVGAVAWMVLRPQAGPDHVFSRTPSAPMPATPAGALSPGAHRDAAGQEWFGDYRLLDLLGRGGMAAVYKAERRGELSALKRPLTAMLEDATFVERFLREADIGRTLNHPNIVRILGRGQVENVPYLNMELLEGRTLQALIRETGSPDPRRAVAIVVQVAEALDFAHGKGVVHRDLKPSNIMVLPNDGVKVMDFGIARARRFEGLTATGDFLGTPDYVAPEIIEGGQAEAASDLYSLGVVFYELLAGRRLFTGDTVFAVLHKHRTETPSAPSAVRPGVPAELDAIVRGLLAKKPGDRPQSAEELVVALRDWLNRVA